MHALILAAAMLGQYAMPYMPPLPAYDPAGYHRQYPEWVGPAAHGVGNPQIIQLPRTALLGNVVSVNRPKHYFVMRTPVEVLEVHYGKGTVWKGVGHLRPGITLAVDQMSRSVKFMPRMTLKQIAAKVPQERTGYVDAP